MGGPAGCGPRHAQLPCGHLRLRGDDFHRPCRCRRRPRNSRAVPSPGGATPPPAPADAPAALANLLDAYEPGADYEPIVDGDFYGPRIRQLATIRLRILATDAKFKVGPAAPVEVKR